MTKTKTKTRPLSVAIAAPVKRSAFERMVSLSEGLIFSSAQRLNDFKADFDRDPHHAFSWSNSAIRAAAERHVGEMIDEYVVLTRKNRPEWNDDQVTECIVKELEAEMFRKARWPESSTHVVSNHVSQQRTAVLAEVVAKMKEL